jgi:hypothetical protein
MATQTATTGELDHAQGVVIEKARYTMEHNMPVINLVEHFRLTKGNKQVTVPKVGQMTTNDLTDGVDLVDSEDINMTTVDLTTAEIGLKVILTDKLVRQMNEDVFGMVGRQMGDSVARKKDTDAIALFAALNGGTVLGADNANLKMANAQGCAAWAKAHKLPPPIYFVHHPNAIGYLAYQAATSFATYPFPKGLSEDLLKDFYRGIVLNGVAFFEDGNIAVVTDASGYGAIFSKSAMAYLESVGFNTERERDASLRGTEVVVTADYGLFELDDTYGAAAQYEMGALSTSA